MAKAERLQVAVWNARAFEYERIPLERFFLQSAQTRWLIQATQNRVESQYASFPLSGLFEILAWQVPEIAFVSTRNLKGTGSNVGSAPGEPFSIYFLDQAPFRTRERLANALRLWLTINFRNLSSEIREAIAAAAIDKKNNWQKLSVAGRLKNRNGACSTPQNDLLYDVLVARAAQQLAGAAITFENGETKSLLPAVPQSGLYRGAELVCFPPSTIGADRHWTEVITVSAVTFPERRGIHIAARVSIRNWHRPVRYDNRGGPLRSLDVFVTNQNRRIPSYHTSFSVAVVPGAFDRRPVLRFRNGHEREVLDWIFLGSGDRRDLRELQPPVAESTGPWALLRSSTGRGDRFLRTGVPFPDRMDLGAALEKSLASGFERVEELERLIPPRLYARAHAPSDGNIGQDQGGLLNTLLTLRIHCLDLHIFHVSDEAVDKAVKAIEEHLGLVAEHPSKDGHPLLRLNEKISIRVLPHPAGPLAQVCQPGEESRLEEYVARLLGTRGGISCAILEMPEALKDDIGDPYPFARRALARSECLAQVLLVDEPDQKSPADVDRASNKWLASVRDCFRMLGVVPEEAFESKEFIPAAFAIIQRDSFTVGGQRVAPFAVPVMSRLRAGALECLLPGEESWLPYAYAALRIFAGQYERWSRGRDLQNTARFEAFFISALEQLVGLNERIVLLIDQESTAHRIKTFQNAELEFDHLEIGGRGFTPEKLANLCIVRINTDYKRAPFYSPTTEVQWPSGFFRWPDQKRTVYSLKQKPASVGGRSRASLYSRHSSEGKEGQHQRLASQLDEMSVIFKPLEVDALRVASYAHRLRRFHEQYDGDTQLPFPLHELLLLKKSVTL